MAALSARISTGLGGGSPAGFAATPGSAATVRRGWGRTAEILATASRAASARRGSGSPATHWAPSTRASISSGVSIRGGMSKPGAS